MKCVKLFVLVLIIGLGLNGGAQPTSPEAGELRRLAEALVAQLDLAHQEALFGALAPNLEAIKRHAQRTINLLEGKNGPGYRADVGEVGDGVGILNYIQQLQERVRNTPLAASLMLGLDTVLFDAGAALDQSRQALQAPAVPRARLAVRLSRALIYSARGSAGDPLGEGGARAILVRLGAGR